MWRLRVRVRGNSAISDAHILYPTAVQISNRADSPAAHGSRRYTRLRMACGVASKAKGGRMHAYKSIEHPSNRSRTTTDARSSRTAQRPPPRASAQSGEPAYWPLPIMARLLLGVVRPRLRDHGRPSSLRIDSVAPLSCSERLLETRGAERRRALATAGGSWQKSLDRSLESEGMIPVAHAEQGAVWWTQAIKEPTGKP